MSDFQTPYVIRHSGGIGEGLESPLANPMSAVGVALPGSGFIVCVPQKVMMRSGSRNALVSDACRRRNTRRVDSAESLRGRQQTSCQNE